MDNKEVSKEIKLSILLLTYNHEKYIAQALESILMQKVNFEYEVIVAEDCSTDKTRDIILSYKDKFKNIRLLFNKKNYGGKFTHAMARRYALCKYISVLEGDDYWTDESKLQQQIDFLDNNPSFVGCAHNTELFYEKENKRVDMLPKDQPESTVNIRNIILGGAYFHTSSYVYRNIFKGFYPKKMCYGKEGNLGDYFLSMLYAKYGDIRYINKIMSCYRINSGGVWSRLSKYEQDFCNAKGLYLYNKLLDYEYNEEFKRVFLDCIAIIKEIPKNYKNSLIIIRTYFLKRSIDVKDNETFFRFFDKIKNFLDKKLNHKVKKIILYKILIKPLIIKPLLLIGRITDKLIMKFFEFLFNYLYFFDLSRYYLHYKIRFYQLFKIDIYISEKYLENNLIIKTDSQ